MHSRNNKIPGNLSPLKKESQGYIDDLKSKPMIELIEILERQEKLLKNKKFISSLPDKGKKIDDFRAKIAAEVARRDEMENTAKLLSRLNIASEGKIATTEMEWTGKYSVDGSKVEKVVELDSDDENDPLKLLAQPTGSGVHKKKTIIIEPEVSLITPEDLEEIKCEEIEEEHVKHVIDISDRSDKGKREKFMPYKTTINNTQDPMKEKDRKKHKFWEVTAATPPASKHGTVKAVSLIESCKLQREYADKLQKIQLKHATERLADQLGLPSTGDVPKNVGHYREQRDDSDDGSSIGDQETEVLDEEDQDRGGTIVYTVES